jgi:hydrogenase-4 component F
MNPLAFVLLTPICAAVILGAIPGRYHRLAAQLNVVASLVTLISGLALFRVQPEPGLYFFIDAFNIYLVALTAFVGFTTSIFSATYIEHEVEVGRLDAARLRFYHGMYQAFMFSMVLVSLYRTREAIEAAWKYFILCGVGIALALFGTILMYLAAQPVMGGGAQAMAWLQILAQVAHFDPAILNLAFVFLLAGYGTKVGLAPFHAWLPDAHAEGPTPISAVLSGLLLNVALYAVLRFKMLLAHNAGAIAPGPLMIGMGLSSLLLATFMLYRRRDIKRLFAYSSIEHMGIITFAFGMGGPLANFAGLLHMTMHSLTKSAIFFAVGHIAQVKGSQKIADIRGLTISHPTLGWTFVIAVLAIAGLPPLGIFMSEFLVVTSTMARQPVLAIPLVIGLLAGFGALILRLQGAAFGEVPTRGHLPIRASLVPLWAHLALVATAGLYIPSQLVAWFRAVATLLG